MFWPKDHLFNCFKQLMLFCWFGSVGGLVVWWYQRQVEDNLLACGNHTDFQLLGNIMCESRNRVNFSEQCYVTPLCFLLNSCLLASMLIDCFKIRFLRKWCSFDYLLNVIYLSAFHGWMHLNEIEFRWTRVYLGYLGLIAFQSLLTLTFEFRYYNRLIVYDDFLPDPMFDANIIKYSSKKLVYICAFLTANRLPQSRWAALAYQLYKHLLICVAQLSIMILIWYGINLDCDRLLYGERLVLVSALLLLFVLFIIFKQDRKSPKVTYIFLGLTFILLVVNLLQKVVATDQLYNLSVYLTLMICIMLTSILALKFSRSFKEHRAYNQLFEREFRKLLFSVYEMCRNKEYFMMKHNFRIKFKCLVCSNLSVDLVCTQCYGAVFNPKK